MSAPVSTAFVGPVVAVEVRDGVLLFDTVPVRPCCLWPASGPHGECDTSDLVRSESVDLPAINFDARSLQ